MHEFDQWSVQEFNLRVLLKVVMPLGHKGACHE
jgi:hypothetical protein